MDAILGPITVGWKGGVGDHFVYSLFLGVAVVGIAMAGVLSAYRDADARSLAEVARTDEPPLTTPPRHASYWPAVAALSVGTIVVGWVLNPALLMAGVFGLIICIGEWTVRAWAENATGDPGVNEEYRQRLASGLEIPGISVLAAGALAMSLSRVLLAVSEQGAVIVAGVVAFLFLVGFSAVAYLPKLHRGIVSIVIILAGLAIIGGGMVSAALGEREIEEHHLEEEGVPGPEAEVEGGSRGGQEQDGQLGDETTTTSETTIAPEVGD
jgi:MFS family permease